MMLTLSEAQVKKVELESAIARAVTTFHAETGCTVDSVLLNLVGSKVHPAEGIYTVKAEVHL